MDWYYAVGPDRKGPLSGEEIEELVRSENISRDTLLWREGMLGWTAAREVAEFGKVLNGLPPPLPAGATGTAAAVLERAATTETPPPLPPGGVTDEFQPAPPIAYETLELARPWDRYFARMFDILVLGSLLGGGLLAALIFLNPSGLVALANTNDTAATVATLPVILIVNAMVAAVFGNTMGRALFGIRVYLLKGVGQPTFWQHLGREMQVWIRGLGLGIPIITIVTMIVGYRKVASGRPAGYDLGYNTVRQKPIGAGRRALGIVATLALIVGFLALAIAGVLETQALERPVAWINPQSQVATTVPAHWEISSDRTEAGVPYTLFVNDTLGIQAVLASEAGPGIDMQAYHRALTQVLASSHTLSDWQLDAAGTTALATGMQVSQNWPASIRVIKSGDRFWKFSFYDLTGRRTGDFADHGLLAAIMATIVK
ncbi:MAG TPA: DUF4339 domain-containing protein [Devosiaceae bacterium]|jgi:hypothetical protein